MVEVVQLPRRVVENFAQAKFPATTHARIQQLMDRNSQGLLSADQKSELEALIELSESFSLLRASAILALRTS
jgi:hypothetical protein